MLPVRNISEEPTENEVVHYAIQTLTSMGRVPTIDEFGNVVHLAGDRAIVAHTDSVDAGSPFRGPQEIDWTDDRITNLSGNRPMGADDKVGVAVALAIAEFMPDVSVILPADEEIGLVGAYRVQIPEMALAIECDRKGRPGGSDLVYRVGDRRLAPSAVARHAADLVPGRSLTLGGETDIVALCDRGLARAAFNLSCGYYEPHQVSEWIVRAEAIDALRDTYALLTHLQL